MPTIRRATAADVALITQQRHQMFADNNFGTEQRLTEMDARFADWLRSHLADDTYIGLLMEDDGPDSNKVLAGAGIYLLDWPPHYLHVEPVRAYLLNFYTAPEARGRGLANQLLAAAVDECRNRGVRTVVLHASPFGRPIYERFGFIASNEMRLQLSE